MLPAMFTEADRALAACAATQHGVFTLTNATHAGLTKFQVDSRVLRVWQRLYEGTFRIPGAVPTWRGDLFAATLAAGDPSAISHRSAAELYELPGRRNDLIEITCRRWERTIKPGLVVHESTRIGDVDIAEVGGIRYRSPSESFSNLQG